jgi:hypothetical protein
MKTIFLLATFTFFIFPLSAQTANSSRGKVFQQFLGTDDIPFKIKNEKSARHALSAEEFNFPPSKLPNKSNSPSKMPVIQEKPEYKTKMPVMVPDSSVQYYLKIIDGKSEHIKK